MKFKNPQFQVFESQIKDLASPQMNYRVSRKFLDFLVNISGLLEEDIDLSKFRTIVNKKTGKPMVYLPIDREIILEFLKDRKTNGASEREIYDTVSTLKKMFEHFYNINIVRPNPMLSIRVPNYKKKRSQIYLTKSEALRLLYSAVNFSNFPERDFAIVLILLHTGIRNSELVNLTTYDIQDFIGKLRVNGKPLKQRYVNIGDSVMTALNNYLEHPTRKKQPSDSFIFFNDDGKPITSKWLLGLIKELGIKAGITKELNVHCLRHTSATLLWESGLDIGFIRQHLGHENIITTEIYTHISPGKDLRHAIEEFPTTKLCYELLQSVGYLKETPYEGGN